ncbi:MAG TPA: extracellular solute-binding protein [Sphaerochaeta sp.]|nr:extracellular solute-binding protein [Sphaerochaeta sp.]
MKKTLLVVLVGLLALGSIGAAGVKETQAKTSITLWDQYYRGIESEIMDSIVQGFEAENPAIKVVRETKILDDLKLVLKMSLESGTGPDVMQVNQGEADMGAMAKAGLLVSTNDVAKQHNWNANFSDSTLKAMGYHGDYYGIATTAEIVGFFYNKPLMKQLGLSIPKTFTELESLLERTKRAGYVPINFGNLDGWTGIHEWSAIQHVFTTRDQLDDMMSGERGAFWNSVENRQAAETLQKWVRSGYFTKDFSAIGYDDSASIFMQGDSLLFLTGNWMMGELLENSPFEVGFFLLPADDPAKLKAIGGPGIPFVVSAKSKNIDASLQFLDYLASQETAKVWADNMMLPAQSIRSEDYRDAPLLFREILDAYSTADKANGMGYFIDWITPTFYDTCAAAVQELMALEITPATFVQILQDDYDAFTD